MERPVEGEGKIPYTVASNIVRRNDYYRAGALVYTELSAHQVLGNARLGILGVKRSLIVDYHTLDLENRGYAYNKCGEPDRKHGSVMPDYSAS